MSRVFQRDVELPIEGFSLDLAYEIEHFIKSVGVRHYWVRLRDDNGTVKETTLDTALASCRGPLHYVGFRVTRPFRGLVLAVHLGQPYSYSSFTHHTARVTTSNEIIFRGWRDGLMETVTQHVERNGAPQAGPVAIPPRFQQSRPRKLQHPVVVGVVAGLIVAAIVGAISHLY